MKGKFIFMLIACNSILNYATAQETVQGQDVEEVLLKNFTVVQKSTIKIVGIACHTSNSSEAGPHDIPKHWGKFYQENIASKIPNKTSNDIIALYCDYEGDYTQPYTFVIGCPVDFFQNEIPEGMVAKSIPTSSYASYRAIGEHPKRLIETWMEIWQTDLERTYTGDFEVYRENFISRFPKEVEVYVAIKE